MRQFIFTLLCLILSIPTTICAKYKLIDSKWDYYFKPTDRSEVTTLPKLLLGEDIYFRRNNTYSSDNLDQFLDLTPDTIWIKRKKKPKLNKDYRLMPYYHGIETEGYAGLIQCTPYSEIENAVFRVDSVSSIMTDNSSYSSIKFCLVFLHDIETSERLIWIHKNDKNADLTVYSKTLGEKIVKDNPSFYYSEYSSYYSTAKTKDYTHTHIINPIYSVDLRGSYTYSTPKLNITLSHNNKSITYPYSSSSFHIISVSEFQTIQKEEIESSKVYTINSKYAIDTTEWKFPFKFKFIYGETKGGNVHQTISKSTHSYSGEYLSSGNNIQIADLQKLHGKNYFIGVYANKCFYIPETDVTITETEQPKLDSLLTCDTITRNAFFNWTKQLHNYSFLTDAASLLDELKGHSKYGLSIVDWGVYDESEYTDGTGLRFKFYNPTKKTIKYITINFIGYNAVDDPVSSYEGQTLTRKCIGPIDPSDDATYEFEYVWFTDIVEYATVKSIVVQYKDGTTKRITNSSKITWSNELYNLLNNSILDRFENLELIKNE